MLMNPQKTTTGYLSERHKRVFEYLPHETSHRTKPLRDRLNIHLVLSLDSKIYLSNGFDDGVKVKTSNRTPEVENIWKLQ